METIKRLGDAELEIMQVLWGASEPVTSGYIQEQLKGKRDWALSTLMTTLARLADKGFLLCDRSTRTNLYTPLITGSDYKAWESRGFLQRMHGGSLPRLVACLCEDEGISRAELDELRRMIDTMEKE